MQVERHSLINEFPEHRENIHNLKVSNHHFARLFDEYHHVDKEIHRLETEDQPVSDSYMEDLKKKRLNLKDELYQLLQAAS